MLIFADANNGKGGTMYTQIAVNLALVLTPFGVCAANNVLRSRGVRPLIRATFFTIATCVIITAQIGATVAHWLPTTTAAVQPENEKVVGSEIVATIQGNDGFYFVAHTRNQAIPLVAISSKDLPNGNGELTIGDRLKWIKGDINLKPNRLLPVMRPQYIEKTDGQVIKSTAPAAVQKGHSI